MPSKGFFFFLEEQQEGAEWKGGRKGGGTESLKERSHERPGEQQFS